MNDRQKKCIVMLCLLYATGTMADGQTPPVTLMDAVNTALGNRPELLITQAQLAGAGAKVGEMRGAFLPTLDLYSDVRKTTNYDPFTGINVSANILGQPVDVSITNTIPVYQVVASAELGLNLYAGGLNTKHYAEASAEERAIRAQVSIVRREVILDIATAYWNLKRAQMESALASEALTLARDDERIAMAKWNQGRIAELARDRASLKTLEAEARLTSATVALREKNQGYLLALGFPPQADSTDEGPTLRDDPAAMDVEKLLHYVDTPQPRIAKAEAEAAAASARQAAQRSEFYPRVDLFLRYNQVGRDDHQLDDAFSDLSRQNRYAGVRLQWNLFNGQQSTYRLKRATEEAYVARMRIEQERADQLKVLHEKQARVKTLPNDVALAEKRHAVALLEARIARAQMSNQQVSEQEYKSREFAVKEAEVRVTMTRIDLALARLSQALTGLDTL